MGTVDVMEKTTATPKDWRGSDLRSRREVVEYLSRHGGVLEDKTGLVVGKMREEMGRGRSLAQLLADMEQDGMLQREVRGRRTFKIQLLDDWGLTATDGEAPAPSLTSVPDVHVSDDDDEGLDLGGVDLTQLAETLLAIVVKRMTQAGEVAGGPSVRELSTRLRSAERALKETEDELRSKRETVTTLQEQLSGTKERLAAAERNVEVLRTELGKLTSRKKRQDGGVPLGEAIGEEGRKALERLMKALPESPGSKVRKTAGE